MCVCVCVCVCKQVHALSYECAWAVVYLCTVYLCIGFICTLFYMKL